VILEDEWLSDSEVPMSAGDANVLVFAQQQQSPSHAEAKRAATNRQVLA
jgi:hypothetical protein